MKHSLLLLGALLLTVGIAFAQATPPEYLNYQGVLRDAADAPLGGNYDMVFRFFDAASVGNELLVDSLPMRELDFATIAKEGRGR